MMGVMKNTKVGQILRKLMAERKIRVAELARRVNLPQPTVHRIATGVCEHPHASSLKPLADFFSVTVDQMKGHEPIQAIDAIIKVPLLAWEQAKTWVFDHKKIKPKEFIVTDAKVGAQGYALKVEDASMEPVFPRKTILVIDPYREVRDRSYVVAILANYSLPLFRQLLVNAKEKYLKPLSPDLDCYKMIKLDLNDKILGAVIQAKRDWED